MEPTTHYQFQHIISWRRLWEATIVIDHIAASETKELHGPNMFNGYHQPGNRKPLQCLRGTSANPGCNSRMGNPAQLGVGATAKPKEQAVSRSPMRRAGCQQEKW